MAKIKLALSPDAVEQMVVLHGISGIGKTQIALAYVMQHLKDYSAIFWLDASSEDQLTLSFLEMAKRITNDHDSLSALQNIVYSHDSSAVVSAVKDWLGLPNNERWLLVYDGYETQSLDDTDAQSEIFDLKKFLPDIRQGHILITTTMPGLGLGNQFSVGKIRNIEHSLQILSQTSERQDLCRGKWTVIQMHVLLLFSF